MGELESGEEGIRTLGTELPARRFSKAHPDSAFPYDSQGIPHILPEGSSTGSSNPADTTLALHSDLARVVERWPHLPPAIRAAIVTLVNTSATTPAKPEQDDGEGRDILPFVTGRRASR